MKPLVPPPSVEGAEAGMEDDPFVNIPPNNISLLPGANIPLSALPLTALTPLPPSTTNNCWMNNQLFIGKKVQVQIMDMKAILHDPGWKNGDYEGKRGVWVGTEGSFALVHVGHVKLQVPPKYIFPIRHSTKGEKVMISDGVLMGMAGKIFSIGQAQDAECMIFPAGGGRPITISKSLIVVIA
ncbi:hypothetical protein C0995_001270 [Termitomyces sp. Mi166|nr:hypothetical protein C0995_001270 [Termitomyces sp. Mi166\